MGDPWTADYLKITGELDVDLRSNIAAEARAKIVYERLINFCDDPGTKDALQFLMTREITHMKAFTAALESMGKARFSIGNIPPTPGWSTSTSTIRLDKAMKARLTPAALGTRAAIGKWSRSTNSSRVSKISIHHTLPIPDPERGSEQTAPILKPENQLKTIQSMRSRNIERGLIALALQHQ